MAQRHSKARHIEREILSSKQEIRMSNTTGLLTEILNFVESEERARSSKHNPDQPNQRLIQGLIRWLRSEIIVVYVISSRSIFVNFLILLWLLVIIC